MPFTLERTHRQTELDAPLFDVKWRFFQDAQSQVQLGVYPQVRLPTGDRSRGLGDGQPAYILPVLAQTTWSKWTLYANVGGVVPTASEQRDYGYAGAVLEREITERLTLGMELFGNTSKARDERTDLAFDLGGVWKLGPHLNLLFAPGRSALSVTRRRWSTSGCKS